MALRSSAAPLKTLFRTQKRSYAIQHTVEKIELDTSRPIGQVSYLFTKQGQRILKLQQQMSLRSSAAASMSIHADIKNGGEAALANLETAQRIVASPTLLAQFKKDAELAKKSKVRAVAWLRDLRTEKEAQAAATSNDATTSALLAHEVAFNEIVPMRDTFGLSLNLTQKASVADWWLAYAAAAQLQASNKTYSTLTGVSIPAEAEKLLTSASVDRVKKALIVDSKKFIAQKVTQIPVVSYMAGSSFAARAYHPAETLTAIKNASKIVDEAAAIPVSEHTIDEVLQILFRARDELLEISASLRGEADVRQTAIEDSLLTSSWASLLKTGAAKAEVETAVEFIKANNAKATGEVQQEWSDLIAANLPQEHKAIEDALAKLSSVVKSIPEKLFAEGLCRRVL